MPLQLLLIEDDDDLRGEIREALMRREHRIEAIGSATGARQALERILLEAEALDAVICDINLADGDGIALYVEFAGRRPGCRWILMSGDPEPERLAVAHRRHPTLPPCIVVEKPVRVRKLVELLSQRGS